MFNKTVYLQAVDPIMDIQRSMAKVLRFTLGQRRPNLAACLIEHTWIREKNKFYLDI